eukprot:PhF_6_TR19611/c0_g1_i1/m.28615
MSEICGICQKAVRSITAHCILSHEETHEAFMASILDGLEPHGVGPFPEGTSADVLRRLDPKCEHILVLTDILVSMSAIIKAQNRHSDDTESFLEDIQQTIELNVGKRLCSADVEVVLAGARGSLGRTPISELEFDVEMAMNRVGSGDGLIMSVDELPKSIPVFRLGESARFVATKHYVVNTQRVHELRDRYSQPDGVLTAVKDVLKAYFEGKATNMKGGATAYEWTTLATSIESILHGVHLSAAPPMTDNPSRPLGCEYCARGFDTEEKLLYHKVRGHPDYMERWRKCVRYNLLSSGIASKASLSMPQSVSDFLDVNDQEFLVLSEYVISLEYIRQSLVYMYDIPLVIKELRRQIETASKHVLGKADISHLTNIVFALGFNGTNLRKCDVCSKEFRDSISMVQHKIQKHQEVMLDVANKLHAMIPFPPGILALKNSAIPEWVVRCLNGSDTKVLLVVPPVMISHVIAEELLQQYRSYQGVLYHLQIVLSSQWKMPLGEVESHRILRWLETIQFTSHCHHCSRVNVGTLIPPLDAHFVCSSCQNVLVFCAGCGSREGDVRNPSVAFRIDEADQKPYCPACWAAWDAHNSDYEHTHEADS